MGSEHVYFPKNHIQLPIRKGRKGLGSGRLADTMPLDGCVGFQFDGFSTSWVVSGLEKMKEKEEKENKI
jgi:hypothetical protein